MKQPVGLLRPIRLDHADGLAIVQGRGHHAPVQEHAGHAGRGAGHPDQSRPYPAASALLHHVFLIVRPADGLLPVHPLLGLDLVDGAPGRLDPLIRVPPAGDGPKEADGLLLAAHVPVGGGLVRLLVDVVQPGRFLFLLALGPKLRGVPVVRDASQLLGRLLIEMSLHQQQGVLIYPFPIRIHICSLLNKAGVLLV